MPTLLFVDFCETTNIHFVFILIRLIFCVFSCRRPHSLIFMFFASDSTTRPLFWTPTVRSRWVATSTHQKLTFELGFRPNRATKKKQLGFAAYDFPFVCQHVGTCIITIIFLRFIIYMYIYIYIYISTLYTDIRHIYIYISVVGHTT